MGNNVVLPTMSIFGISDDPDIIAEKLFLYFLTSEYSQSVSFYGKISSLKYLLTMYSTRPKELESAVRDALIELYNKYFKSVDVEVSTKNDENKKTAALVLIINITCVSENGAVSTVEEELTTSGTNINNLLDLIYR